MKTVDRSGIAKPSSETWGYWIPEPSLLLGCQTQDRVERYLMNWLRIRTAWQYLLDVPNSTVTRVQPQWWRDYLNGELTDTTPDNGTRRVQRLEKVKDVFGRVFDMLDYATKESSNVAWFQYTLSKIDSSLAPKILWEVFEIGFRHELLALDRVLVPMHNERNAEHRREEVIGPVFHAADMRGVNRLPDHGVGLCALSPRDRVRYIQALREVLIRWPLVPPEIYASPPLTASSATVTVEALEFALAGFYVKTFYMYSGRAPIVPHMFPL